MKLCLIGPFPPPMNGNSKALDTLVRSKEFNDAFECHMINLNQAKVGQSGKFSLEKVNVTKKAVQDVKKLKDEKIDCYYITTAQSAVGIIRDYLIVRSIKKTNKNAKIVAHLHGGGFRTFYDNSPALIKRLVRRTYGNFDKVIVLSGSLVDMFDGLYPKEKTAIRYNCVDNEFLFTEDEIEERLSESKEYLNVTYLSNMIESKGYRYLVEAAKIVHKDYGDIRFSFAGRFPSEEQEALFAGELENSDLKDYVSYLGTVSGAEKKELLRNTDIFVLPTRYPPEGQPIAIIEAMAAGAVILTTDQGGIPDIIKDGVNGYYVNDNYAERIAENIIKIRNNPQLRREFAINNNRCVYRMFTEKHYVNGMIDEITEVCEKQRK